VIGGNWPESRISLPGGWLVGETLTDCRRYHTAVLRPLTGYEEEWLAQHQGLPNAIRTTRLLDACILALDDDQPRPGFARGMLVGDRDFLMLQLRRLTLGDRISAVVECPACRSKMDTDFDAAEITVESGSLDTPTFDLELPMGEGCAPRAVRFRLPAGADQEAVLGYDAQVAADNLLERCLIDGAAVALASEDKSYVAMAIEQHAPRVDLELELACPECRHAFVLPFDTTAFFLDEVRITMAQLLREVHWIALYYHWSEAEILSLVRDRRRQYLSLIADVLRRE